VTLRYFPNASDVRQVRPRLRAERSDGVENRQRILAAGTAAVIRDGLKVPLATVASAAGVGIGTLYRHFPSRAALLDGLVVQSLRLVVDDIRAAAGEADTAIEAVRGYFYHMIERRDQLILPLRGGPVVASAEAAGLREEVGRELGDILRRGLVDGTVRAGLTPLDLINTPAGIEGMFRASRREKSTRRPLDVEITTEPDHRRTIRKRHRRPAALTAVPLKEPL
jgi:AcrR family transcriptional regulator